MRRATTVAVVAVAIIVWLPAEAAANGGAYMELDRTYYVHGTSGEAEYYADIPPRHQDLLERGPFYGYLLPLRARLVEGRPLPASAVRVGTFAIEEDKGDVFEFTLMFDTPALATGEYQVRLCNDPCTITGFREPVTGYATIAATATEVALMRELQDLRGDLYHAKREAKRSAKELVEVQAALDTAEAESASLASEASELREDVAALEATPEPPERRWPTAEAWALVVVPAFVLGLLGGLFVRRVRRPAPSPAPA
jgi:hypothetical protein